MRAILISLALVAALLAILSARDDSATADEPAHILSGLMKLRHGRLDFYAVQPPLMNAIVAAPLAVAGYEVPRSLPPRFWVAGRTLLYRSGYDARTILALARAPVIVLFLALSFAVAWFVHAATGDRFATVGAFALTAFCPNLLAHGRLATVDLGATFFLFIAAALFLRLGERPARGVALACGVATACAVASKTSSAAIVFFFLGVMLVKRRRESRAYAIAGAAATGAFMAIYLLLGRSLDPLLPFRAFWRSVTITRQLYAGDYTLPQFLLGEFSRDGWPHYHLVALLLKTTLPALLLVLLTGVVSVRRRRFAALALLAFAALFLVFASFSSLNLGLRHVLPVYPFAYAAAGVVLSDVAANRRSRVLVSVLLAAHVLTAIAAYPSFLSYFNPLIGSHRNADAALIDSNLDWGQDLHRLGTWARRRGIDSIRVHYFGGGSIEYELGARGVPWPAPRAEPLPKGWFAVSRHIHRVSFDRSVSPVDYDAYLARSKARYVTTVGGSIDVYRVD